MAKAKARVGTTCLTMHQPYASLLVWGFHCAEGRVWSSEFRGKLWIHAAAKALPPPSEVEAIERDHVARFSRCGVQRQLPKTYPTCVSGRRRPAVVGRWVVGSDESHLAPSRPDA